MGNGIISGLLGGAKGFGDAMTVMADDRRKQLAERLKMELEESMKVAGEERGVKNAKDLATFENELPMGKAVGDRIKAEEEAAGRLMTSENLLGMSTSDKAKLDAEHSNRMAEIGAQGEIQKYVADKSISKADVEAENTERLMRAKQLAVKLKNMGNIDVSVAEDGSLMSETPIPEGQKQAITDLATQYGIELAFNKTEEGGFLGFGSKPVSRIAGSAFNGNGIISGKLGSQTSETTTETGDTVDQPATAKEHLNQLIGEVTGTKPEVKKAISPKSETETYEPKSDKIGASGSLFGYRGAEPEPLPTTVEGWNKLAEKVGLGSENWKSLGELAKKTGGAVWNAYRKIIDKTGMFSVESQKKAMKESGLYK